MKHIDEYYKEWRGESHLNTSNLPTHDSSEMTDFAEFYHKEMIKDAKCLHPFLRVISAGKDHHCTVCKKNI